MMMDPFRLYRRHQRELREAAEEAAFLRRRYGEAALDEARQRLMREDLTHWGRRVIGRTVRLLQQKP